MNVIISNKSRDMLVNLNIDVIKSLNGEISTVTEKENEALLNEIFKIHNINLEIIVDKDNNIYFKSKEIVDLMKKFGAEKEALFIGDNYIKLALPGDIPSYDDDTTVWEFIEGMILSNELYTEDVIAIEYFINVLSYIYTDENLKMTKKADGSHEITIDVTKDDYMKAMKNTIDDMWEAEEAYMGQSEKQFIEEQKQEMINAISVFDFYTKAKITIKDEMTQTGNLETSFKINDMLLPETENGRLSMEIAIKVKSTSNKALNREKVEIPENAIDIMNY